MFQLTGFHTHTHTKKTLLYFNSTPKNSLNLGVQLQSSRWWYEPESKCVHIQSLVLVCKTVEQIMKAKQVSPVPAIAATANSSMADITPLAPCWHLWYPGAVVFQWKCDRAKSPSWAAGRMCVASHAPGVGKRGLPGRVSTT